MDDSRERPREGGASPAVDAGACIERCLAGNAYASAAHAEWSQAKPGIWSKRLYHDPVKGETTQLVRIDPGASSPLHWHDDFEQIHVISGSFDDGERVLRAGDHCCRAPGARHTLYSAEGALVLVINTPA